MPIKITSTVEGFRRCGIAHTREPVVHDEGTFTKEQIEVLKKDPMLKVEFVAEKKEEEKEGKRKRE